MSPGALARLRAGLDRDAELAQAAMYPDPVSHVEFGPVADLADRFSARRVLDRVEAIRAVLEECMADDPFGDYVMSTAVDPHAFRQGVEMAAERFIVALASIYPEEGSDAVR